MASPTVNYQNNYWRFYMSIYFSEKFHVKISGHKDIQYIDVNTYGDTPLYWNPYLVEISKSDMGYRMQQALTSYFQSVFECCYVNDQVKLLHLLNHASEVNEAHLGMSKGVSCGKGSKPMKLMNIFVSLIDEGCFSEKYNLIQHPMDLIALAPMFGEDKMSDLCLNVLRRELFIFNNSLELDELPHMDYIAPYWDPDTKSWRQDNFSAIECEGKPLMLIPKIFVTRYFTYNAMDYLQKYVLTERQNEHLQKRSALCRVKQDKDGNDYWSYPTKHDIYHMEVKNIKDYNLNFSKNHPDVVSKFRHDRSFYAQNMQPLSDAELDSIVYQFDAKENIG